jgi:hypothetical protein
MERVDVMGWRMSFRCSTMGAPKRGKRRTVISTTAPTNLAEMLEMIRGMGFRPEDIAVHDIGYETEHQKVRFDLL